jgi:hypothetical protein
MNGDGYLEWNINNITACQWGCQDDYSGATERHTASCNEAPNDLLRYQSAVNQVGATFSTAFEGPVLRFSISIVAFIIAFGLGMYFTRSVTFGFGAGTGVLGIAIAAGWVPTFLVVAIFAIAAYMVFKAWTGGELTG